MPAVQSRHLVDWIEDELIWLGSAGFAEVSVEHEATEGPQSLRSFVGGHEVAKICPQPIMVVKMEPFEGCVFDRSVHPPDLAIDPQMIWPAQAMHDPVCIGDRVKANRLRSGCLAPQRTECRYPKPVRVWLQTMSREGGQDGLDMTRVGHERNFEALPSGHVICLVDGLGGRELAGSDAAHRETELALR